MFRFRSINQLVLKIKILVGFIDRKDVYAVLMLVTVSVGSFMLGALTIIERKKAVVTIEMCQYYPVTSSIEPSGQNVSESSKPSVSAQKQGMYVGSKQGNKFHLPECAGAKQISEVNKVWFSSKEEAISRGYTPALNCKGI